MFKDLMQKLTDRRDGLEASAEEGFTLIELMVVLLIMGILLAIAIPTFLGVTGSANDRAAQANLSTTLTSGKTIYEQHSQVYPTTAAAAGITNSLPALIAADEPSLPMATGAPAALTAGQVSAVASTTGNGAAFFAFAKKTKVCWWVADNATAIATAGTTTTLLPWTATTATSGLETTTTGGGVPMSVGEWYGAYVVNTTNTACDAAIIMTALSTISSSGFPTAP